VDRSGDVEERGIKELVGDRRRVLVSHARTSTGGVRRSIGSEWR
jgi:hypothetical protein